MRSRIAATAVLGALCGVSCHTVVLKIERRGSAGIVDKAADPLLDIFDGHAIAFPTKPFVNRFDTVGDVPCILPVFTGYTYDQLLWLSPHDVHKMPTWLRKAGLESELAAARAIASCFDPASGGAAPAEPPPVVATAERVQGTPSDVVLTASAAEWARLFQRDQIADVIVADEHDQQPVLGRVTRTKDAVKLHLAEPPSASARLRLYRADLSRASRSLPQPILSFVHISDAQIREPAATLGGQDLSKQLDPLIQSFAHDYDQELYSAFVYEAFIQTINQETRIARCEAGDCPVEQGYAAGGVARYRVAPRFMIHTGDSIDAGLASEFDEFRNRSDGLVIPWYSVVGNHDVLGFGNLMLTPTPSLPRIACTPTSTLLREFYLTRPSAPGLAAQRAAEATVSSKMFSFAPFLLRRICLRLDVEGDHILTAPPAGVDDRLDSIDRFVKAHCRQIPSGDCDSPGAGYAALAGRPASRQNGFDLHPRKRGYYAFPISSDSPHWTAKVWVVVLNTSSSIGAYGELSDEQACWLDAILVKRKPVDQVCAGKVPQGEGTAETIAQTDVVLVFGHHPLWNIDDPGQRDRLHEILFEAGNVPAYFAGHTHTPQLRVVYDTRTHKTGKLWEVIAPSTLGFPQQARQVTLKVIPGSKLGYLEVLTFEPRLQPEQQEYVRRANLGAERDQCDQYASSCENGRPKAPSNEVSYPRLFFRLP